VPTGTANFNATTGPNLELVNIVNQPVLTIGQFVFGPTAPAYSFRFVSDTFEFTGQGIVNNGAATHTLLVGNRATIRFRNASSAGNAVLNLNESLSVLEFRDNSTAATANIVLSQPGNVRFNESATAANAVIDIQNGTVSFAENSTAGNATIANAFGLFFGDNASLGTATITGTAGGIGIAGNSSGASATIVNQAGSTLDVGDPTGAAIVAIGSLSGGGTVRVGGRNLSLGNLGRNETISGAIQDGSDRGGTNGQLTKTGAGTLILTGTNNYAGGTTISGGALQIGNGGDAGAIIGNIANNAALVVNRTGSLTLSGLISGSGTLTLSGAGTLVLTADNTYSGHTTINSGTLQLGDGGWSWSFAGGIFNASSLVVYV
jgi:fibronectin-binding autotransporter adhesin